MPFFLNPFTQDFEGNLLLGDRHHIPKFVVKQNTGRIDASVRSYSTAPFDLSGNDADGNSKSVLTVVFSPSINDFKSWTEIPVTISASSLAATTISEVVDSLNNDATFSTFFLAIEDYKNNDRYVGIKSKRDNASLRFYIKSGRAETVLLFNKKAGVGEIPSYFSRHTIANRFNFPDSANMLIELDPNNFNVDADIIDNAVNVHGVSLGYDSSLIKEDWELLRGKSGIFTFKKQTVDGSDRITEIIEYPAGALEGDFAKKTLFTYTADNLTPNEIMEIPHVLTSGDLITP